MLTAALDIGSSKVAMVIARVVETREGPQVEIVGAAKSSSSGVKNGNLVDLRKLAPIIYSTVQEASKMAGTPIRRACVNINGEYLESFNVRGVISLGTTPHPRPIEESDIRRVMESARNALSLPTDRAVIHMEAQQYIVDDVSGVRNPVDMQGTRLEAEYHVVTASQTVVNNLIRCLKMSNLEIQCMVMSPLAAAYGVTTDYEREQGVLLIDLGAETTGLVAMKDNSLFHSRVIGLGGHQFTTDLATVLGTSVHQAERIKRMMSSLRISNQLLVDSPESAPADEEMVQIPHQTPGGQPMAVPRARIQEILDARSEELMLLIRDHLIEIRMLDLVNHVVLTGGGALILGLDEIAQAVFDLPTRIGYPVNVHGIKDVVNSPVFAVAIGMIQFLAQHENGLQRQESYNGFWNKLIRWFRQVIPS